MNIAVKNNIWSHVEAAVEQYQSERKEGGITFSEWLLDHADIVYHLLDKNFTHERIVDFINNARDMGEINLAIKLTISNFRMTWYRFTRRYNIAHNARDTKVKNIHKFKEQRSKLSDIQVQSEDNIVVVEKPVVAKITAKPTKHTTKPSQTSENKVSEPPKDKPAKKSGFDEKEFAAEQRGILRSKFADVINPASHQSTTPEVSDEIPDKAPDKNEVTIEEVAEIETDLKEQVLENTDEVSDEYDIDDNMFNTSDIDDDMEAFVSLVTFKED